MAGCLDGEALPRPASLAGHTTYRSAVTHALPAVQVLEEAQGRLADGQRLDPLELGSDRPVSPADLADKLHECREEAQAGKEEVEHMLKRCGGLRGWAGRGGGTVGQAGQAGQRQRRALAGLR